MSFLSWMALISGVLLLMALASSYVRDLPITTSAVYLALGLVLGPLGAGLLALDVLASAIYVERITEVAVIVALFVGGLKLRLPWRAPAWRAAFMLAGPVMIATVLGITAVAHLALGLALGPALLLGAVLAPTDPVLASAVAVNDADDHDRMRYGLSGEAGLNDGTAFPFVVFGLAWITHDGAGTWIAGWALHRLLWAVPAGLALGFVLGTVVGRLAIAVRARHKDATAPSDLLALALIGLAYVGPRVLRAWGLPAVFPAGVAGCSLTSRGSGSQRSVSRARVFSVLERARIAARWTSRSLLVRSSSSNVAIAFSPGSLARNDTASVRNSSASSVASSSPASAGATSVTANRNS